MIRWLSWLEHGMPFAMLRVGVPALVVAIFPHFLSLLYFLLNDFGQVKV